MVYDARKMVHPPVERHRYEYDGPVMEFGRCICNRWCGSTLATSEKKARSNLAHQFKKKYNKAPGAKITLPGDLTLLS